MSVNVSKPSSEVRSTVNSTTRKGGKAGERVLQQETPQEIFNTIGAGRRNIIINGDMRIHQRDDSVTGIASSGYYTADRFSIEGPTSSKTVDNSVVVDGPPGFEHSFKISRSTSLALAAADYVMAVYKVEAQDLVCLGYGTNQAKPITISFWVKSTSTGVYALNLYSNDSGSARINTLTYDIHEESTWEYKSITFYGDPDGDIDDDNGVGMWLQWFVRAGTNKTGGGGSNENTWVAYSESKYADGQYVDIFDQANGAWQITGVQMEIGEVATPFEHRPYGEELARCQRYYQEIESNDNFRPVAAAWSSNDANVEIAFHTEMRTTPAITVDTTSVGSGAQIYTGSWLAWTSHNVTPSGSTGAANGVSLQVVRTSGYTAKDALFVRNFIIKANAEL